MARITDREVKALAGTDKKLSEAVGARGEGTLIVIDKGSRPHAFYRYTAPGTGDNRVLVSLGIIGADTTLQDARTRAHELATIKREHPDLKGWIEVDSKRQQRELEEEKRRLELESRKGTLVDLLGDYISDLKRQDKVSAAEVKRFIHREVIEAHPELVRLRACDVGPNDIRNILAPVWTRGACVQYNRGRSYLLAAFQFGLTSEYDVARKSDKSYGLTSNPVAALPRHAEVEIARERSLSDGELCVFYHGIGNTPGVGALVASFLRFCITSGGQRPAQLLDTQWKDYNFEEKLLRIEDRKGRSGLRVHIIPLSDRSLELLEVIRLITGEFSHPWTSTGKAPITLPTLSHAIERFLDSEQAKIRDEPIPHFTAKDLRRTCKQAMTRAKIPPHLADALQNHEQTGVVGKHYRNNPVAKLPMLQEAMSLWDDELHRILESR